MSPIQQWWLQFFFQLSTVLPYFAAGTAAVVIVSLTPFGRALTRYLRDSRRDHALPREIEDAIGALRAESMEVLERVDFLERAVAQRGFPSEAAKPALPLFPRSMDMPSGRVRTPV